MERNPQAEQMASDAMVDTLSAQAEALWPLEAPLFDRYGLGASTRILDIGCGTGEVTARLAARFPHCKVMGVDVHAPHLERARATSSWLRNVRYAVDDAFDLAQPDDHYDLVVSRHVVQSLPQPEVALKEMFRVCKPGGHVHVLAEDYGMMHFGPTALDADRFWREGPWTFASKIDNDLRIGRKMLPLLRAAGFAQVSVDYLTADSFRVDRAVLARIWRAWADGYTDVIVEHTALGRAEVERHWEDMIEAIESPEKYALWHVPIWSGTKSQT